MSAGVNSAHSKCLTANFTGKSLLRIALLVNQSPASTTRSAMATLRLRPRSALGLLYDTSRPHARPLLCNPCARGHALRFQSSEFDQNQPPRRRSQRHPRNQRVPRWRKNEKLPLGVDSLGSPGQIVVIKPDPHNFRARKKPPLAKEPEKITLDAMLGELEEEASALTMATVERRFESYRPSNAKLTVAVFEDMRKKLAAAFTTSQLSHYIAQNRTRSPESEIFASKWWPETAPSRHNLKGKTSLAERILRDCWQVNISDEVGQLDLQLRSSLISLLLHADHFSFDRVASLHQANIDVTHSLGLVQITARRDLCESICEKITDAISRVHEMDVGLGSDASSRDLGPITSPRFLKWLNETYGVVVEQTPSKLPGRIIYLAENKNGADGARRTLQLAVSHAASAPIPFSTYLPALRVAGMHHHHPEAHLLWFDRQKQWFRWSTSRTTHDQAPFFDSHQTEISDELLKLLRAAPNTGISKENGTGWGESVTASLGKCLFTAKSPLGSTAISASQLCKSSSQRAFATEIPQASSFLQSLPMSSAVDGSPIHLLRLLPSIQSPAVLPELEVLFRLKPPAEKCDPSLVELQGVKLIFNTNHVDYLLPENGLDLRFTRRVYRTVQSDESLSGQALMDNIRESLRHVKGTNAANDHAISKSAFTTIPLPLDLLPTTHVSALDTAISSNNLPTEYILPPLSDARGAIVQPYDFHGRELLCGFSGMGPFLPAQTTAMSLHLDLLQSGSTPEDPTSATLDPAFHSFYKSACQLAFETNRA